MGMGTMIYIHTKPYSFSYQRDIQMVGMLSSVFIVLSGHLAFLSLCALKLS